VLRDILHANRNPSAWELIEEIEARVDWQARWVIKDVITMLSADLALSRSRREYLQYLVAHDDLKKALAGAESPRKEVQTGIDSLIRQSLAYRNSDAFQEMIGFMGRFRDYAPYNNMLVRIQNPSCSFYATEADWDRKFGRTLKEDAKPMFILAPMHPVMLVYELDQTVGEQELPKELNSLAKFDGAWRDEYLDRTIQNAFKHYRIRIDFKRLSSTNAGFATVARGDTQSKMRIAIHKELDPPSRYGVICHELAHILLGHLGTDSDYWWPSRTDLNHKTVEIEAEAVAFIVTQGLRLKGSSAPYVSRHLGEGAIPASVSLDLIAKVAGRLEEMSKRSLEERTPKIEESRQQSLL
jgi:IrrE N-terminal-like domain